MLSNLNPNNTSLLAIDLQVDFCSPDGSSGKNNRGLVGVTQLLPQFNIFHEKISQLGITTFFTRFIQSETHTPENFIELRNELGMTQLCIEGTRGMELYGVHPKETDIVLDKYYYDCFANTSLGKQLKEKKTRYLLISGIRTDICVDTTAKRAISEGFVPLVLEDLVYATDTRKHEHSVILEALKKYHAVVLPSTQVLHLLEQSS